MEEDAAQAETAAQMAAAAAKIEVRSFERRKPARRPLPAHLPRERIVYPAPSVCPCCGDSRLRKIGEDVTETLELVPRQWKVVQHVREKFSCRSCEAITQPLAKVTTPPGFPRILGPGESYQVGPNKGPDPHRQTARQSNLPAFSRSAMFCAAAFEQPRGARVLGGRGAI